MQTTTATTAATTRTTTTTTTTKEQQIWLDHVSNRGVQWNILSNTGEHIILNTGIKNVLNKTRVVTASNTHNFQVYS